MSTKKHLGALALAAALSGLSGCGLTYRDAILGGVYTVAVSIDVSQTVGAERDCSEGNPILGPCGHGMPVWIYFPAVAALTAGAAIAAPRGFWRTLLEGLLLGVELKTVVRNFQVTAVNTSR